MTMASQSASGTRDPRALRRVQPLNQALPTTLRWIDSLPPTARPHAVLRDFPRIANALARSWPEPGKFDLYLESLLLDRRGGRRGFPADVHAELIALREHAAGRGQTLPRHARNALASR